MPETIGRSYPIDPWEFLMFPVLFLETDLRYRRGRGSCSLLGAYGETQLCLTALLVLALEIIDIKMINIFLESGNYLSSWERMGNRSLRYIQILAVTQQSTVLLYKIILPSSSISFSSTPSPPVLLLCSVSNYLFASLLPCPAELCWLPWNQEIKPLVEDFLLLGSCIACFKHTKLF